MQFNSIDPYSCAVSLLTILLVYQKFGWGKWQNPGQHEVLRQHCFQHPNERSIGNELNSWWTSGSTFSTCNHHQLFCKSSSDSSTSLSSSLVQTTCRGFIFLGHRFSSKWKHIKFKRSSPRWNRMLGLKDCGLSLYCSLFDVEDDSVWKLWFMCGSDTSVTKETRKKLRSWGTRIHSINSLLR